MTARQFFKISPKGLNKDMVLAVYGRQPGANVLLWSTVEASLDAQLFYEEPRTTTIRNKINDHCLDVNRRGFIVVNPFRPDSVNQQWRIKGDVIQNGDDETRVIDASGYFGLIPRGQPEATTDCHAGLTQRWAFLAA